MKLWKYVVIRRCRLINEFYVYLSYIGGIKTAIITDNNRVIGIVGDEEMSNTDLLRAYSRLIQEHTQTGKINTNHKQVKYRRLHTSDFEFNYIYRNFSESRRKHFIELAYQWTDEQDAKLKSEELVG